MMMWVPHRYFTLWRAVGKLSLPLRKAERLRYLILIKVVRFSGKRFHRHGKTATGGNLGPAVDQTYMYVPLGYELHSDFESAEGLEREGGLVALEPETGEVQWTVTLAAPTNCSDPASYYCTSANQAAVTAIEGALFTGSVDGTMRAF